METILTGLRTNSDYHLGNYIGAILPVVNFIEDNQDNPDYRIHLFAPDLHSFTTPIDFGNFYRQTITNLSLFVACGVPLNRKNVYLYRQSRIPAHSELTWILSNFAGFGDLSRMVEFKEKSRQLKNDQINVGLFTYPILMAADILLYDAKWVPVGEDQKQHLEFCRRLANSFNYQLQTDILHPPASFEEQAKFFKRSQAPRIRSLARPETKMSKSVNDPRGTILLSDSKPDIQAKIQSAATDSLSAVNYDWERQPGITNLLTILAHLSGQDQNQVNRAWQGKTGYGQLKSAVIEVVSQHLEKLQAKLGRISHDELTSHLQASEGLLSRQANAKLAQVHQAIGLVN